MIGWAQLREVQLTLSDVSSVCRLETSKLEVTVPSEQKLRELAFKFVEEGYRVNFHTRTSITILRGRNDECVIWARVKS
jgi:hypothetical protein